VTAADPRLRALADVLPKLEAPDADFGRWQTLAGRMPWYELGPTGQAFRAAAIGWVTPAVNWMRWMETEEGVRFRGDPSAVDTATPEQLERLLTALIRSDRFTEGTLAWAFESGMLARIARRAGVLADGP
jgi:hypothetical protein